MKNYFYFLCTSVLLCACSTTDLSTDDGLKAADKIQRYYQNPWEKDIGYAEAVRAGDQLHVSGVVSIAETMEDQVTEVYGAIQKILEKFDKSTDDIISERVYTTDIEALKNAASVRKTFFSKDQYPAATWVQVERLYLPETMLEVEVIVLMD